LIFILTIFVATSTAKNIVSINTDNTPPNPPGISGPTSGKVGEYYTYKFKLTDPDENDYLSKLEVDFGDGVVVEQCGCNTPWENGITIEVENMWKKQGTYQIKARVADVHNYWSEWSEPYPVSMPKYRAIQSQILTRMMNLFPILEKFLA